jgi:hypothetical protein
MNRVLIIGSTGRVGREVLFQLPAFLRRFCELAVFDARLYFRVRRVNQPA